MNRYIAQGILNDLADCRDVVVVAPTLVVARHAFDQVVDRVYTVADGERSTGYRVYRANGRERIVDERTGAVVRFTSYGSGSARAVPGTVVVLYEYRAMIGDHGDLVAADANVRRLRAIIGDRDTVVID